MAESERAEHEPDDAQPPKAGNGNEWTNPALGGLFDKSWELELLISGFLSFGLIPASNELVDIAHRIYLQDWLAGMPDLFAFMILFGVLTGSGILLGLDATFLAHLCLRGFWAALISMEHCAPASARKRLLLPRDKAARARHSPEQAERKARLLEKRAGLRRYTDKIDELCSNLFSIGFFNAVYMLSLFVFYTVAGGLAYLAYRLFDIHYFDSFSTDWGKAASAFVLLLGLPLHFFIFSPYRQLWAANTGKKYRYKSILARLPGGLRKTGTSFYRFASRALNGIMFRRPMNAFYYFMLALVKDARLYPLFIPFIIGLSIQISSLAFPADMFSRAYKALPVLKPAPEKQVVANTEHASLYFYADQHNDLILKANKSNKSAPYIDRQTAGEDKPFVQLFVPFTATLDARVAGQMEADNAEAGNYAGGRTLKVLQQFIRVSIDDTARKTEFVYQRLDVMGSYRPGLTAFFPTYNLSKGLHRLEVRYLDERQKTDEAYCIPFYVY